jgi:hypothetical protein
MIPIAPIAAGAEAGGGIYLAIRGLAVDRPDLSAALERLSAHPATTFPAGQADPAGQGQAESALRRLGGLLAARAGRSRLLPIPRADLAIIGRSVESFFARKLLAAGYGLALPAALAAALAAFNVRLPVVLPAFACLALAAVMFVIPDLAVRSQANEARADFRAALGAYFDLVALERAADGGPSEALSRAAAVGHGWVFTRIRDALAHGRLAGDPPWVPLARLADDVGVADLADLADTISVAGGDGAAVYDTLLAKARSLRGATLTAAEKTANSRSEAMTLPTALLGLGFIVLVGYPAFARIVNAG